MRRLDGIRNRLPQDAQLETVIRRKTERIGKMRDREGRRPGECLEVDDHHDGVGVRVERLVAALRETGKMWPGPKML